MVTTPKSSYIHLFISVLFVLFLAWCSWQLHSYSNKYQLLKIAFLDIMNEKPNTISPVHRLSVVNSLEQQLACASSADINFVQRFKRGNNYPENVLQYTINTMTKMQTQPYNLRWANSGSELICDLLVNGGANSLIITLKFFKKDDKLLLMGVDNICPLFNKVRCFEEFQASDMNKVNKRQPAY